MSRHCRDPKTSRWGSSSRDSESFGAAPGDYGGNEGIFAAADHPENGPGKAKAPPGQGPVIQAEQQSQQAADVRSVKIDDLDFIGRQLQFSTPNGPVQTLRYLFRMFHRSPFPSQEFEVIKRFTFESGEILRVNRVFLRELRLTTG
jgi:hypothetical protein